MERLDRGITRMLDRKMKNTEIIEGAAWDKLEEKNAKDNELTPQATRDDVRIRFFLTSLYNLDWRGGILRSGKCLPLEKGNEREPSSFLPAPEGDGNSRHSGKYAKSIDRESKERMIVIVAILRSG